MTEPDYCQPRAKASIQVNGASVDVSFEIFRISDGVCDDPYLPQLLVVLLNWQYL
jgi:hypothetical protein